jgi:Xaa-Pro dipeptidase
MRANPITVGFEDAHGEIARFDAPELRAQRLQRLQTELRRANFNAGLFFDPLTVRYATGTRNMAVWLLHNPARYCFVPADGKPILFEFPNRNCQTNAYGNDTLAEVRLAKAHFYTVSSEYRDAVARQWAREIADLLAQHAGRDNRLAVDRLDAPGYFALQSEGVMLGDGIEVSERARLIKTEDEAALINCAVIVAERGIARVRQATQPGITENQLLAELHAVNISSGGEWMESRLLTSGPRTNPWFQEASERVVQAGDLVSLDTDLIGPHGYCADISRSFVCGPSKATSVQQDLYTLAHEQIQYNAALLGPGVTYAELAQKAWKIPNRFKAQYYGMLAHGVGMADEGPVISYDADIPQSSQGVLLPGMCVSIESYTGEENGVEGVKLEQQYMITEVGAALLGSEPLAQSLETTG